MLFVCEEHQISGFRFGWRSTDRIRAWSDEANSTGVLTTEQTIHQLAWNHLVLVREGAAMMIYRDGSARRRSPRTSLRADVVARSGGARFMRKTFSKQRTATVRTAKAAMLPAQPSRDRAIDVVNDG